MSKKRIRSFKIAGIINFITAIMCAVFFVGVFFNLDNTRELVVDIIKSTTSVFENYAADSIINFALVYSFVSFAGNLIFGIMYIYYSKMPFEKFAMSQRGIWLTFVLNIIVSISYLSIWFVLYAMILPITKDEEELLIKLKEESEKEYYYKRLVASNATLFAMSVKIRDLKEKLKNKQITQVEYDSKLKEILNEGVSHQFPHLN